MSLFSLKSGPAAHNASAVADDPQQPLTVTDLVALNLAQEMAERIDVPIDEVWSTLCNVSHNLLSLLESPEGWVVLSSHVAETLGHGGEHYVPRVH